MKLNGVFEKVLEFVDNNSDFLYITSEIKNRYVFLRHFCILKNRLLIYFFKMQHKSATNEYDQEKTSDEFDFMINCIWSSAVVCVDLNLNIIFSPADTDLFHENFTKTFEFLSKFEVKCSQFDKEFKKRLADSQSYKYFVKKWPIQVYFQIRFQEIVSKFEEVLLDYNELAVKNPTSDESEHIDTNPNTFYLVISETLIKQMEYCWIESKCFLKCLLSQFWKLNLQLVARYANFFVQAFQNYAPTPTTALTSLDSQQSQPGLTAQGVTNERAKTPIDNDLDSTSAISAFKKSPIEDLNFCVLLLNDVNKLSSLKVK